MRKKARKILMLGIIVALVGCLNLPIMALIGVVLIAISLLLEVKYG